MSEKPDMNVQTFAEQIAMEQYETQKWKTIAEQRLELLNAWRQMGKEVLDDLQKLRELVDVS